MSGSHLVRRFFTSLRPGLPAAADEQWVATVLSAGELPLYARLANHDRRHAIQVGRRAQAALGPDAEPRWIAAALLHDVGKFDAHFSVPGRAIATVAVVGTSGPNRVARWEHGTGLRRRVALYARHGEIGAREIRAVGGRDEAATWSEAHHHPETWADLPIPAGVIEVLDAADQI